MKGFNGGFLLIVWLALVCEGYAQVTDTIKPDHIIVLVDVSGSVKPLKLADSSVAGRLVYEVLHSGMITQRGFVFKPQGGMEKEGGIARKWTEAGKKLLVVKYGDLKTDSAVSSQVTATLLTDDFGMLEKAVMQKWPTRFLDQWSYQKLALYRAAALAKREGFTSYWLFVVSDDIHEQRGEKAYNSEQQKLLQFYQPKDVEGLKLGVIEYMGTGSSNFKVDIRYINLDSVITVPPSLTHVVAPPPGVIHITKKGKKDEPAQFERTLTWTSSGTSVDSFMVYVSGVNGTKLKPGANKYLVKGANSISLPLEEGTYRITVEGTGTTSDTTYVQVGSGDWSWLWWLLLVVVLVLGGVWFLRRKPRPDPQPYLPPRPPGPTLMNTDASDLDL